MGEAWIYNGEINFMKYDDTAWLKKTGQPGDGGSRVWLIKQDIAAYYGVELLSRGKIIKVGNVKRHHRATLFDGALAGGESWKSP
jgi:hypothetical protein